MPIFFLHTDGRLGLTPEAAAAGRCHTLLKSQCSVAESSHPHLTRSPTRRSRCQSLAECCLRVLLEYCAASDAASDADADEDEDEDVSTLEELASVLVPHHRKEAVRMCAVRCPLSGARLRTLLGEGRNHVILLLLPACATGRHEKCPKVHKFFVVLLMDAPHRDPTVSMFTLNAHSPVLSSCYS
jgi:hypothetical protein